MFNLINILGQNTLPEQVEINKQNIAILADEVEKLGYQPKGVYDSDTEYNHNDVVFYDNKLYVVTSDAAIVGVLPTNTTYWQQVTGDIRGQQGATGAQGPAGADGTDGTDGTDGVDALVCIVPYNSTNTAPTQGLIINGGALNFNRRPKLNDRFILIWNVTSTNSQYLCIMSVDTEGVIPMQCTVQYEYLLDGRPGEQGEQGETGEMALVYGQVIHRNQTLVENEDIVLTGLNMLVADFNRAPKADDQFVLLYFDTYRQKLYIGYAEVEGINSSTGAVTTVLYRDMHIVTGADGQNGTNGTDGTNGKDALTINTVMSYTTDISITAGKGVDLVNFNRTPLVNEYFTAVYTNSTNGKSWLAIFRVDNIQTTFANCYAVSFVETTGAQGASPAKLYLHYITYNHTSTSQRLSKFCFSCINNNPNWDDTDNNVAKLIHYLTVSGLNSVDKMLPLSGYIETTIGGNVFKNLIGVYSNLAGYRTFVYDNGDGTVGEILTNMGGSVTITTVELQ